MNDDSGSEPSPDDILRQYTANSLQAVTSWGVNFLFTRKIGQTIIASGEQEFLSELEGLLKRGAYPNTRLSGNGKILDKETPLDYYLRREALYVKTAEDERTLEMTDAAGEAVYTSNAVIARNVANLLRKYGAKTSEELDAPESNVPKKPGPARSWPGLR